MHLLVLQTAKQMGLNVTGLARNAIIPCRRLASFPVSELILKLIIHTYSYHVLYAYHACMVTTCCMYAVQAVTIIFKHEHPEHMLKVGQTCPHKYLIRQNFSAVPMS